MGCGLSQVCAVLDGSAEAGSWAIDCHKWLNVPYDSAITVVRGAAHLRRAMSISAAYLPPSDAREPCHYAPQASRRARGIEIWAAMRSLGRSGLRELIERSCEHAKLSAECLREAGFTILNEVVLNQMLVSFGTPDEMRRVIAEIQNDGTCWCGGTQWQGQTAMRISVSNWATTHEDVTRSVEAMVRIAKEQKWRKSAFYTRIRRALANLRTKQAIRVATSARLA